MSKQHEIQIAKLDKKINDLKEALACLGKGTDLTEMLVIIHRPGWTTLREVALSVALVDSLAAQVSSATKAQSALVKAAQQSTGPGRDD